MTHELLWKRHWRRPTAGTRDALARAYAPLASVTARRLSGELRTVLQKEMRRDNLADPEDLLGAASLGLLNAIDRFDPQRGVQFETYAIALMRGKVKEEMRQLTWMPRTVSQELTRLWAAQEQILLETGQPGTPAAVAGAIGLSEEDLSALRARVDRRYIASFAERTPSPEGDSPEESTLGDCLSAQSPGPEEAAMAAWRAEQIEAALDRLPAREACIVRRHAGMQAGGEAETFAAIAGGMGICESRVYQLYQQGVKRLRKLLELRFL